MRTIGPFAVADSGLPMYTIQSEYTWLATGGLSNFNADKCAILKGNKVIIYPDLNAFDNWKHKAEELRHITKFTVTDILQTSSDDEERVDGFDLADYLIGQKLHV